MNKKPVKNLYKWGIFYFNPDDENLIAQQPKSLFGWTLNFAKPLAYVFLLISLLILMLVKRLIA